MLGGIADDSCACAPLNPTQYNSANMPVRLRPLLGRMFLFPGEWRSELSRNRMGLFTRNDRWREQVANHRCGQPPTCPVEFDFGSFRAPRTEL